MQRVHLITVGSLKSSWAVEGCNEYLDRIKRQLTFELLELPPSKQKDPAKQSEEESQSILKALEKLEGDVWVLDERGKQLDSNSFAEAFQSAKDSGSQLVFVIGGAYGLSEEVRNRADHILSLSASVLPHELCRLVFLEKIYRSTEIMKGSGYHH